ncbi:hypothetical protein OD91_1061 [Lutibacter sp. Hel_I_33_5]|nr:hypothetical protein OD91_1061 [Lutibacter sp. Hel_I_33_5]
MNKIIFYAICFIAILCGVFFAFFDNYSLAITIFLISIAVLFLDILIILINKYK